MKAGIEYPYPEAIIASELGVRRAEVRDYRIEHLQDGEHWIKENRQIVYNDFGFEALKSHFLAEIKPTLSPELLEGEKTIPDAGNDASAGDLIADIKPRVIESAEIRQNTLSLTVRKTFKGNTRILRAAREDGHVVTVRVRDSAFFTPGMRLPRCREEEPDVYVLLGKQTPKRKGKW